MDWPEAQGLQDGFGKVERRAKIGECRLTERNVDPEESSARARAGRSALAAET
jgi:hypothetical protein